MIGLYFIDAWQRAIVMNANMECPGDDGNWPGDDEAKERGIKYVVTGRCESNLIQTATIGEFVWLLPVRGCVLRGYIKPAWTGVIKWAQYIMDE